MNKQCFLEHLKEGLVLCDGGYLMETEKRGWVLVGHFQPPPVCLEAPIEQPLRLALPLRNESNRVLGQSDRCGVLLDVGDEAVLVLAIDEGLYWRTHAAPSVRGTSIVTW